MQDPVKGKKIFVGLSGGVDSAVTAALLKERGAEVTGVFIKGAYPEGLPCTWAEDRRDAMRVAAKLGIPFLTLDGNRAYQNAVIDYLVREYSAGRTPNPDVMCNRDVKFGVFYDFALAHGADYVATGHYARIQHEERAAAERYVPVVLRGIDGGKDQSYFLWAIKRDVLSRILFPLGELNKSETRSLATKFGLPVAHKKDSQGICFLGNVSIEDFLRKEIGLVEGNIVDETGKELGRHAGAIAYTLGERMPLADGPWYVVSKNIKENAVVVAHEVRVPEASDLMVRLIEQNWQQEPEPGRTYGAQYRYHGAIIKGSVSAPGDSFVVTNPLNEPLVPGQSLVVYDGDTLIGGGIIA